MSPPRSTQSSSSAPQDCAALLQLDDDERAWIPGHSSDMVISRLHTVAWFSASCTLQPHPGNVETEKVELGPSPAANFRRASLSTATQQHQCVCLNEGLDLYWEVVLPKLDMAWEAMSRDGEAMSVDCTGRFRWEVEERGASRRAI